MNRRQFLGRASSLVGVMALGELFPGLTLFAASDPSKGAEDHFFVLLRTFGGMDVTLGLDPQILPVGADSGDLFLEYRPDEILRVGGIRLAPAAKALAPHASDCVVLNGIMMRQDSGHDVANQYMITGRGDGKAASLPIELALSLGAGPFGVILNLSTYLAGKSVNLSMTSDILSGADEGSLIDLIEQRLKLIADQRRTPFEEAEQKLVEAKATAMQVQKELARFKKETPQLKDRHVLAAAFASRGARWAQLEIPGGVLDTHSNHEKNHLQAQTGVWQEVAEVFKLFKSVPYGGGSLFNHTTFMVMSEFSRTPALNPAKGKDHNPYTNSILLAGKGIQGGKTVGASRLIPRNQSDTGMSDHIAWPYDYKQKRLATEPKGASFFYPENVIQTVGKIFASPAGFAPVNPKVHVIPGVVRK